MKLTKRQLRKIIEEACGDMHIEKEPDGKIYGSGGSARMAKSQLYHIAKNAAELNDILSEKDELPEWVQSKIAVMKNSMDAILDHLAYKHAKQHFE